MAYTDGKVEYSEEDVVNAPMWNAGSVYFDDEIVEYQSRYYIALCKTSAQVPGRSKQGIWKELVYEEDEVPFDDQGLGYEVEIDIEQIGVPKRNESIDQPVKKKTVKERQEEQAEEKKAITPIEKTTLQTIERKMTITPSDQSIVNEVLKEMEFKKIKGLNSDENNITSNLILAQKAKDDIKLTWESSHPDIISTHGKVIPPEDGHDVAVNLSLTVSKEKASATRFFTLWVKGKEKRYSDTEAVELVYDMLDFDHFKGRNVSIDAIVADLELLTEGLYDTKIFWASSKRDILDETGKLYTKRVSKKKEVRLYAIITRDEVEKLKRFDLILKP